MNDKYPDDMGGLWIETGAKGEYMTGTINGVKVVCFRNDQKTGKQPDWRVKRSKPREEGPRPAAQSSISDESIPF